MDYETNRFPNLCMLLSKVKGQLQNTKGLWTGCWIPPMNITWTNKNVFSPGVFLGNANPAKSKYQIYKALFIILRQRCFDLLFILFKQLGSTFHLKHMASQRDNDKKYSFFSLLILLLGFFSRETNSQHQ